MHEKNILKEKSFEFALKIVELNKYLVEIKKEFVMSRQLLKSGIFIGAMVREPEQAESKADFIHKLSVGLKEANESEYWLELLYGSAYIDERQFIPISSDLKDILRLLISIIKHQS